MHSNEPGRAENPAVTGRKAWSKPVAVAERAAAAEALLFVGSANDGTTTCSS